VVEADAVVAAGLGDALAGDDDVRPRHVKRVDTLRVEGLQQEQVLRAHARPHVEQAAPGVEPGQLADVSDHVLGGDEVVGVAALPQPEVQVPAVVVAEGLDAPAVEPLDPALVRPLRPRAPLAGRHALTLLFWKFPGSVQGWY